MSSKKKRRFFGVEMLRRAALKEGVRVVAEPEWGEALQLIFKNGTRRYIRSATVDINCIGSAAVALDKGYARFFMKKMGYPVPRGQTFFREDFRKTINASRGSDAACTYAKKIGFPVIIKPNSGGMGEGVFMAHTEYQVRRALRHVFTLDRIALIEEFVDGRDVRVLVLDGEVVAAYERIPLSIEGDGNTPAEKLLVRYIRALKRKGRVITISVGDLCITDGLKRQGYTSKSIIPKGVRVPLLVNANLSTGGSLHDVTHCLHVTFKEAAIRLAQDMGLRFCGVDMLINGDVTSAYSPWCVLEVNASPSVKHFACHGRSQRTRVESLYRELLIKMGQS